ncbi:DHA2 family efflux MFS transporter permease subunit [Candidatus Entotheonella palauensis]|nr:DHA2 family efflux MFS transporter permease subunit [Candidatus Entotheonella palauensis]
MSHYTEMLTARQAQIILHLIGKSSLSARDQPRMLVKSDPNADSEPMAAPPGSDTTLQGRTLLISPQRPSYKWWVAGTVMLSSFMVVVNTSTVNVTLPPMMTAFGLNLDQAQWVITAYMIASAVLIPTVGWLGNWLGNRNLFLLSLLVFISGSALSGLAWSGSSLILFRVLQGIGGGPITPMVMVYLSTVFPERQRGLAMGLYGMASAFGPAVGPVLGGYVTDHLSWRMVFYMNILPGLVCFVLVLLVIPNTREAVRRSLDLPGLLTLVIFLVSLLIALTQGQRQGWDSSYIQRLLLIAGASFAGFVCLELFRKEPLVELRLYSNLAFAGISLAMLITSMTFWGTGFLQTILLQRLLNYTPAQAGYIVMPGALILAMMMLAAGRLADKVDRRLIVWGGLVMFALGSYLFSFLTLQHPMSWMIWMIAWRYAAIPFIFTPMNAASLLLLPPDKVRMGSGLINLLQQGVGGTLGLAFMTTVLQQRTSVHATLLDQHQALSSLRWSDVLSRVQPIITQAGDIGALADVKSWALVYRHLLQQATVAAYQDCFILLTAMAVVVMPLMVFLRKH